VTYGGHGIWGWDDGSAPPIGHDNTGIPRPWQQALLLPAAEQLQHLTHVMRSLPWWQLQPAQAVLAVQPGNTKKRSFIAAARADDLLLLYLPENDLVEFKPEIAGPEAIATWINPRNGEQFVAQSEQNTVQFRTPGQGDWLLLIRQTSSISS
jgi:hypothetical protein